MSCGCKNNGVQGHLCHHQVETLGLVATSARSIKDGSQFDDLFPKANLQDKIVNPNGTVKYTVSQMEKVVQDYHWQSRKLAKKLEGKTLPETLENIWNFYYTYLPYKLDKDGVEELRTPARAWHDGQILYRNPSTRDLAGIDCDCYSISVSCVLTVLNIPHRLRVTKYSGGWQHVYVVVPVPNKPHYNWIVDCVLDKFNIEKTYSDKFDYNMSGLGIPVAILSGLGDAEELHGITSGNDFDINGFGGEDDLGNPEAELGAIKRHLIRTRNFIAKNPESVIFQGGARNNLQQLDFVLNHWDTPNRMRALTIAAKAEHDMNVGMGLAAPGDFNELDGIDDPNDLSGFEGEELSGADELDGTDDMHDVDTLGRAKKEGKKAPKQFIQKVRKAAGTVAKKAAVVAKKTGTVTKKVVKKAGAVAKKAIKAVVRYNPLTLAARGGFLLFMKQGLLDMAKAVRPGYWTLQEAKSKGIKEEDWNAAVRGLNSIKKIFINTLQGKEENLKKAIIEGSSKKGLSGFDDNLGSVAVAITAASVPIVAAGTALDQAGIKDKEGFARKVANFFKGAGKKIVTAIKNRKAKKAGKKAAKKAKKTNPDGSVENEDGSTTLPDGSVKEADGTISPASDYEPANSGGGNEQSPSNEDQNTDAAMEKIAENMDKAGDAAEKTAESTSDENSSTNGEGSNNAIKTTGKQEPVNSGDGFLDKAKAFVSENPGKTALIGVGVAAAITMSIPASRKAVVGMFSKKKGLSGVARKKKSKSRAKRRRTVSPNTPYSKRKVKYVKM